MDRPRIASEIMVTKLVTISPETNVTDGISHLLRHNISGAPVADAQHNYLGVFSEKCCLNVLSATAQLANRHEVARAHAQHAKDFMTTRLITLTPEMDVVDGIAYLLKNRISGAPVVGANREFLGVFSEKTSMKVLVDSAYDRLPTNKISAFMNTETKRIISEDHDLLSVIQTFLDTPYRRLPVLRKGELVGQVSRRDALRAQNSLDRYLNQKEKDYAILEMNAHTSNLSPNQLPSLEVASFMDCNARTITPEMDLFSIAHVFLSTPYRRLPVIDNGKLVGQISRRDVLQATHESLAMPAQSHGKPLYLSSVSQPSETPFS